MSKAILLDRDGTRIGEKELPEIAFGIKPNEAVVHQYIETFLANQRQGTQMARTISEVSGGGKKPWKQKGTGRARAGTNRSPLWRHGGVIFAPTPRDYRKKLTKKMRKLALASALSSRAMNKSVFIFEEIDTTISKTSGLKSILEKAGLEGKSLLVTMNPEPNLMKVGRNLEGVEITFAGELNTYQVVSADNVIFASDAIPKIEELCSR